MLEHKLKMYSVKASGYENQDQCNILSRNRLPTFQLSENVAKGKILSEGRG